MSLNTHDLYELTDFTGRQNDDPLLTIIYSLGQIMAGLGPIFAGPLLGAILTLGGIGVIGLAQALYQENERRRSETTTADVTARCDFPGDLTVAGAVTGGTIYFREHSDGTLEIYGDVTGLTDGAHAFHIHEFGGLGNACADAGGHFDPDQVST